MKRVELTVCNLAGVAWARALGPRAVVVLLGVAIVAAANVLPLLRPNLAVGIRTTQSLDDRRVWSRMHRLAGRRAVVLGCITCVATLGVYAGHDHGGWTGVYRQARPPDGGLFWTVPPG